MNSPDALHHRASALLEAAHAFHQAAETPGSHGDAPASLASLQETLQVLSTAWYRLAADAIRMEIERSTDLSREQEVTLIAALHDVAAAFARGARACREGQAAISNILARRLGAAPVGHGLSWFTAGHPPERVPR
jgi:hypothetical protein